MSDSRHVQTELSIEEYRHLKALAQERDLSLAAALHEAVEYWITEQSQIDPNDPLFDILRQLEEEPLPDKPRTNAAMEDDLIEEWSGGMSSIRFSQSIESDD